MAYTLVMEKCCLKNKMPDNVRFDTDKVVGQKYAGDCGVELFIQCKTCISGQLKTITQCKMVASYY